MTRIKIIALTLTMTFISACSSPQESVIKNYLEAKTPEERYESICKSSQIALEDLQAEYKGIHIGDTKDISFDETKSEKINDHLYMMALTVEYEDGETIELQYNTLKNNEKWCVDWVSTSRTPGFSFDDMYFNGTSGGKGFFNVTISDYYNYELSRNRHSHYSLYDIDFKKHYYLSKKSQGAKEIFDCVKGGDFYCSISAEVYYPATKRNADILLLDNAKLLVY